MPLTFIDTNALLPTPSDGHGRVTEVLSESLCGAKNGVANVRWLEPGEAFCPALCDKHQLIYLMEGDGRLSLNKEYYHASKGAGIYLGPKETTTIEPSNNGSLKLFHLIVPKIQK